MLNEYEMKIANDSYTKLDFYQIYPEILEIANKLSNTWDPASSNESDPGVVLLKLLAFIADKNNYNIDKNVLECFMPSATQEDSMKKLCDMMGYDMHYYVSATTSVGFMWVGDYLKPTGQPSEGSITIPMFTQIRNEAGDINYFLTENVTLNFKKYAVYAEAIEGKWEDVIINEGNSLKLFNLDDNNRFYLPEKNIAENGIWIWNAENTDPDTDNPTEWWTKVSNLNSQQPELKVWKFGYDSRRKLPYIQFPEDIADLIGEGLRVRYTKTSGYDGNIIAKALVGLSGVTELTFVSNEGQSEQVQITDGDDTYLIVSNNSYTLNGKNPETIDEAYNNFKKTVGTFDTLVTCRDYANAIYNLTVSNTDKSNLVSNIQVSDIRDDINFSNTVATFNDFGLVYVTTPELKDVEITGPVAGHLSEEATILIKEPKIDNFDLYLYPLNPVSNVYKSENYASTFKPNVSNFENIKAKLNPVVGNNLNLYKTLSHQLKQISLNDNEPNNLDNIYLIKNYYKLNAKISTTYKVNEFEGKQIIENIKIALFKTFNSRNLEYGQEIPFDALLSTIEQADYRIKSVSLEEPEIDTAVMLGSGEEKNMYDIDENNFYSHLLAKNIVAGRLPFFDYDNRFVYSFGQINNPNDSYIYGANYSYPTTEIIPESGEDFKNYSVTYVTTELKLPVASTIESPNGYYLRKNQQIQVIAPNIVSKESYSTYVYYYLKANDPVEADRDYQLKTDEILYFYYSDEGVKHIITYKYDGSKYVKLIDGLVDKSTHFSGIIRSNVQIQNHIDDQSEENLKEYYKTLMTVLSGTDTIETRDFVRTQLTTSPIYCYWKTNNNNKITFKGIPVDDSASPLTYKEYIYVLNNNEYFFYTDSGKNSLVTLGSGTTLKLIYNSAKLDSNIVWDLSDNLTVSSNTEAYKGVDLDAIANKGIGAFADTDWVKKQFSKDIVYLEIEENQIFNIGEDRVVTGSNLSSSITELDNTWQVIPETATLFYDGKAIPEIKVPGVSWKIRTILNLNVGPDQTQELKQYESLSLYTNAWYINIDGSGNPVYLTEDELKTPGAIQWNKTKETILPKNSSIKTFTNGDSLRSNYLIQEAGGENVSVHVYNLDGTPKDDLYIYPFTELDCIAERVDTSPDESEEVLDMDNVYSLSQYHKITLNQYDKVKLPVYIPKEGENDTAFGVFMIYYVKGEQQIPESGEEPLTDAAVYFTDADEQDVQGLMLYSSGKTSTAPGYDVNYQNSITLKEGINVIRVKQGGIVWIDRGSDILGSVTIGNLKIVNLPEDPTYLSGLNYKLFGVDVSDQKKILDEVWAIDVDDKFYYNCEMNQANEIDIEKIDEYFWFNSNNICNKFVLPELNTDFSGIQIAKSSRLSKW